MLLCIPGGLSAWCLMQIFSMCGPFPIVLLFSGFSKRRRCKEAFSILLLSLWTLWPPHRSFSFGLVKNTFWNVAGLFLALHLHRDVKKFVELTVDKVILRLYIYSISITEIRIILGGISFGLITNYTLFIRNVCYISSVLFRLLGLLFDLFSCYQSLMLGTQKL